MASIPPMGRPVRLVVIGRVGALWKPGDLGLIAEYRTSARSTAFSVLPIVRIAMKMHDSKYENPVVTFRVQNSIWKSPYQRPPDVAFNNGPRFW